MLEKTMRDINIINLAHSDRHDASITELCVLEAVINLPSESETGILPKKPSLFTVYTG
jgi:hypothetical protein